jgi:hypothetical protein
MSQSLPGYFGEWIEPSACKPKECDADDNNNVLQHNFGYCLWPLVKDPWKPIPIRDFRPKALTVDTPGTPTPPDMNTENDSTYNPVADLDAFDKWWAHYGSSIRPLEGNDHSEHAYRIARASWLVASQSIANH